MMLVYGMMISLKKHLHLSAGGKYDCICENGTLASMWMLLHKPFRLCLKLKEWRVCLFVLNCNLDLLSDSE